MMDVTQIATFLGGTLYLASVFDAFSRTPLALQTFDTKPGASSMARLLKTAVRAFGKAKYLITDQGGEFKGRIFRKRPPNSASNRGSVLSTGSSPPHGSNASGEH